VTKKPRSSKRSGAKPPPDDNKVGAADIYRLFFHGPAYQVVKDAWPVDKDVIGHFASGLPSNHEPTKRSTLVMPRLIELCFQTAGIWDLAAKQRMGLPSSISEVRVLRAATGEDADFFSVVTPESNGAFDAYVVDKGGSVYLTIRGYRTMELPDPIESC
jgi:hypothetical protein